MKVTFDSLESMNEAIVDYIKTGLQFEATVDSSSGIYEVKFTGGY